VNNLPGIAAAGPERTADVAVFQRDQTQSYSGVSPKSKKQRMASMQLPATQGKGETEIKIAGSRNFDWVNQANIRARQQRGAARQAAGRACGRVARLATRSTRRWGRGLPRWSRSDGHMSWCPDGTGGFEYEGPIQGTVGWAPSGLR